MLFGDSSPFPEQLGLGLEASVGPVSETWVPGTEITSPLSCPAAGERVRPAGGARAPSLVSPSRAASAPPGPARTSEPRPLPPLGHRRRWAPRPRPPLLFLFREAEEGNKEKCRHEGREPLPPPTPAGPERHEPGSPPRPLRSDRRRRRGPI
ncbi:proline-rich protein 2-like [Nannospalax galili]|uniref:proline-rich protein 2-like n=1 Tax=Nannospalax galili TaxID=1026970 RepID=UPI000819BAE0|nr:proline-rich protein 2-like [Nannospalax galili]